MLACWAAIVGLGVRAFGNTHSRHIPLSLSSLSSLGFGTINQNTMVYPDPLGGFYQKYPALIANLPQLVLASVYFMNTNMMTAMFSATNWAGFGRKGQYLTVSSPVAKQRGTTLLGAPLIYAVPLLSLQVLLHWFVSQSFYIVRLLEFAIDGSIAPAYTDPTKTAIYSNLGYSPIAIICTIVAFGVLYITTVIPGLWSLPVGTPPVVSTCSAAISTACHIPSAIYTEAMIYGKCRWGVTAMSSDGIGRCSLGPEDAWERSLAEAPIPGILYA